jgi:hypothetical protein
MLSPQFVAFRQANNVAVACHFFKSCSDPSLEKVAHGVKILLIQNP